MPVTPVPKLTAEEPQVNVEVSADALPSPIVVAPATVSALPVVSSSPAVIVKFHNKLQESYVLHFRLA